MKVIKEESEALGLLKIDDDLFTCDTPLRMMFNEFSRLSGMDDDLFTYEVEIHKFSYFPSVEQQMDDLDNGYLDVYERKVCYDECEKIYAEAVIFINKRLVRLIDVTMEQIRCIDYERMIRRIQWTEYAVSVIQSEQIFTLKQLLIGHCTRSVVVSLVSRVLITKSKRVNS
ncbi:hypothetical protein Tco_1058841 [Tanacetum coccineum]